MKIKGSTDAREVIANVLNSLSRETKPRTTSQQLSSDSGAAQPKNRTSLGERVHALEAAVRKRLTKPRGKSAPPDRSDNVDASFAAKLSRQEARAELIRLRAENTVLDDDLKELLLSMTD